MLWEQGKKSSLTCKRGICQTFFRRVLENVRDVWIDQRSFSVHDYPLRSPRVWLSPVGKRQKDYTCSRGCNWSLRVFVAIFVVVPFHLTFTVRAPLLRILFQEILWRKKKRLYISPPFPHTLDAFRKFMRLPLPVKHSPPRILLSF